MSLPTGRLSVLAGLAPRRPGERRVPQPAGPAVADRSRAGQRRSHGGAPSGLLPPPLRFGPRAIRRPAHPRRRQNAIGGPEGTRSAEDPARPRSRSRRADVARDDFTTHAETAPLFRYGLIADLRDLRPGDRSLHTRLEIVCLDDAGRPQFNALLFRRGSPVLAVFDVRRAVRSSVPPRGIWARQP